MKFIGIAAQLEFLSWRDTQLSAISLQLEEAFPELIGDLSLNVEQAGIVDLLRSTIVLKSSAEAALQRWGSKQLEAASRRAEAELDDALLQFPGGLDIDSDVWEHGTKVLPAIAGMGLIAASVAAIPTVASFATVSTSVLAFWGTATISWPLFTLGAIGIGLATLTGSQSLKLAEGNARRTLCNRLHREAGRRIFGIGDKPGARCMLSDIQAAVVRAGQNRIQGIN